MNYIVLDLEWNSNCGRDGKKPFDEIIEIGAVKLNEKLEKQDVFTLLVHPVFNKKLSKVVKNLTKLTNEDLKNAKVYFSDAYKMFEEWLEGEDNVFLTFSKMDILVWRDNLRKNGLPDDMRYMSAFADVQKYCQAMLGKKSEKRDVSLSEIAEKVGVDTAGMNMHHAIDDALITAECFKRLFDPVVFSGCVTPKDKDFFRRITHKVTYLQDITNPFITPEKLTVRCPECGSVLKKTDRWTAKNRSFRSLFKCGCCEKKYFGTVRFRVEYERIVPQYTLRDI